MGKGWSPVRWRGLKRRVIRFSGNDLDVPDAQVGRRWQPVYRRLKTHRFLLDMAQLGVSLKRMENRSIAGLDLIRFAAAVLVIFFHLGYFEWRTGGVIPIPALAPFAALGWVGVEIFFVLSGFVIAYSAVGKSPMAFARSRFLRLYPAVWICATIALTVGAGGADAYLRSITLWPFAPWVDGVYWTLGVEMVFYGLVFLTLFGGGEQRLSLLIFGLGALSSLFWFVWLADHLMGGDIFGWTMGHRYFELLLVHYGCFFALGGAIWLIGFSKPTAACTATGAVSFIAGAICIYAISAAKTAGGEGYGAVGPIVVWMAAVGGIVASVRYARTQNRASESMSRTLGLATYPLYLLHHVVGVPIMLALIGRGLGASAAFGFALFLVVALSILVLKPEGVLRRFSGKAWDLLAGAAARKVGAT